MQIAIVGSVKAPGVYNVQGLNSLSQILALAGGLNAAAIGKIQILHGTETIMPTDEQVVSDEATFSSLLKDGDILCVIGKKG